MKKVTAFIENYKFHILSFAAVFALVFIVFYHTTKFSFIYFDDVTIIMNKVHKMDTWDKVKGFMLDPVFDEVNNIYYRPILNLSFAVDTIISGGELGFYHYTNVLMHVTAIFLIFIIFKLLGFSKYISLSASLIIAVHPALVSATAWVPGRNDVLLGILFLFSFIFFIRAVQSDKAVYYILACLALSLAIFSKETGVVIPVIFGMYLLFYKNDINRNKLIKTAVIAALPLLLYMVFRTLTISQGSGSVRVFTVISNLLDSFPVLSLYTGVIFLTEKIYLYPQINLNAAEIVKGILPVIFMGASCIYFRKIINFKHVLFGLGWYILFLLPTFSVNNYVFLNHRLYIPIIGMFIVLLEVFIVPLIKTYPVSKKFFYVFIPALIAVFAFVSYKNTFFYRDRESFWVNAYHQNPSSVRANIGVSKYYNSIRDYEKAEYHALNALNFDEEAEYLVYTQLGNIYSNTGKPRKALEAYKKAYEVNKYNEYLFIGASKTYEILKDEEMAEKVLSHGLELMPKSKILKKALEVLRNETDEDGYIIVMTVN